VASDLMRELRRELAAAGWGVRELHIIHRGASVVLHEPERGLIVKVAACSLEDAEELLQLHIRLAALRAPVLAPIEPHAAQTSFGVATLWPVARTSSRPAQHLGEALTLLHQVDPAAVWTRRSGRDHTQRGLHGLVAQGVPEAVVLDLARHLERLPAHPSWADDPGQVLVHGDAHCGNVLIHQGRPVLIDLDRLHHGPAELDLIPTWATALRSTIWADWTQLKHGYGLRAVTEGLETWRHLQEAACERDLTTTMFLARFWGTRDDLRAEVRLRLADMDGAAVGGGWSGRSGAGGWWWTDEPQQG
jgi:hypothetical protein